MVVDSVQKVHNCTERCQASNEGKYSRTKGSITKNKSEILLSAIQLKMRHSFRSEALWNESAYKTMKYLSQIFLINSLLRLHLFLVFGWYTNMGNFYWWLYTVKKVMLQRSGIVVKHFVAQYDAHSPLLLHSIDIYFISHRTENLHFTYEWPISRQYTNQQIATLLNRAQSFCIRCSASDEISSILWSSKIHYSV
jgi:hypothetical protein